MTGWPLILTMNSPLGTKPLTKLMMSYIDEIGCQNSLITLKFGSCLGRHIRLSNFRVIGQDLPQISWLRSLVRSYTKTSYSILKLSVDLSFKRNATLLLLSFAVLQLFWYGGTWVNPLHAKFVRRNKNIYLHFMSSLHIGMTQVVEIFSQVRQGRAYSTINIVDADVLATQGERAPPIMILV